MKSSEFKQAVGMTTEEFSALPVEALARCSKLITILRGFNAGLIDSPTAIAWAKEVNAP